MSQVKIQGNASGTGIFTVAAPNSNTDRTLTLPDVAGTLVSDDGAGKLLKSQMPSGSVIQVVSTEYTGSFSTAATTDSPANSGFSISITPRSATSKIFIIGQLHIYRNSIGHNHVYLKRNGTTNVHANSSIGGHKDGYGSFHSTIPMIFLDSPATTSSTSYVVFLAKRPTEAGDLSINDGSGYTSTLTALEIVA